MALARHSLLVQSSAAPPPPPRSRTSCSIVVAVMHKHGPVRFLRNYSGAVPVASFHIIALRAQNDDDPSSVDRLWRALNDPRVEKELRSSGRHYGASMWKVETGNLAQLTIPRAG
jgi:hypothetical protein